MNNKQMLVLVTDLVKNGWTKAATIMTVDHHLAYGLCMVKEGKKVYINKDTYVPNFDGSWFAKTWVPVFNKE